MTASQLLDSLNMRGVKVWADGETVRMDGEPGVLRDADREAVRAIKPQMLALLSRPPLGSIRCPRTVWGTVLRECPHHTCGANVQRLRMTDVYFCEKCETYFELCEPLKDYPI